MSRNREMISYTTKTPLTIENQIKWLKTTLFTTIMENIKKINLIVILKSIILF